MNKLFALFRSCRVDPHAFLVLIALSAAGCGGSLPTAANPEQAQITLQEVLNAWQKGETVQSLKTRVPAIHVNDPDWRNNKKLVKYKISTGEGHGNSWSCKVTLTLQDGSSRPNHKQANYTVDTEPNLVVVRDVVD